MCARRIGQREDHTAPFFSNANPEGTRVREQLAEESLEMLIQWLKEGGNVGIHGASLSLLRARRLWCGAVWLSIIRSRCDE